MKIVVRRDVENIFVDTDVVFSGSIVKKKSYGSPFVQIYLLYLYWNKFVQKVGVLHEFVPIKIK